MNQETRDELDAIIARIRNSGPDMIAIAESRGRLHEIIRRNEELRALQRDIYIATQAQIAAQDARRRRTLFERVCNWLDVPVP